MTERDKKLRKLQDLRSATPFVSKNALEAILGWIKENGEVPLTRAKNMREADRATLAGASAYGPLLLQQDVLFTDGTRKPLPFVNFLSFLHKCYKDGGPLYDILKDVDGSAGLVLYSDEVCPGNALSASTPRKCWAVYATFTQCGQHMQNEKAWVTLCCLRSSVVQKVEAGMSQIFRIILKMVFQNEKANVSDLGLLLQSPHSANPKHLKIHFAFMVQDGLAHKQCWSLKGDAGSRFCALCKNCFTHGIDEDMLSPVSCWTKMSQLDMTQSQEIFSSWDRMAGRALACSAADFKQWQQAAGITFHPEALLADTTLRQVLDPCRQYFHDWMHCLMSNGVLSLGVFNLLEEMGAWANFGNYVSCWNIPSQWKHCGINVTVLFNDKRVQKHRSSNKFNSTASELLTVLPILAHYLKKVCLHDCRQEAQCIQVLAHLVELLQHSFTMAVDPSAIEAAAEQALALWASIGWKMIKKHHWLLHLGQSYRNHRLIVGCWTVERKHRFISRIGAAITNTTKFEQSMLETITAHELHTLGVAGTSFAAVENQLKKPHHLPKKLADMVKHLWPNINVDLVATSHTTMLQHGVSCSKGDVVLLAGGPHWSAGQIQVNLSFAGQPFSLVTMFDLVECGEGQEFAIWIAQSGNVVPVPVHQIVAPLVYSVSGQRFTTLIPLPWR